MAQQANAAIHHSSSEGGTKSNLLRLSPRNSLQHGRAHGQNGFDRLRHCLAVDMGRHFAAKLECRVELRR